MYNYINKNGLHKMLSGLRFEKEIYPIKNLAKNKKRFLSTIQKYKDELREYELLVNVLKELENSFSEDFKDEFKKDTMLNILNYMFDKDFIRHNQHKGLISLEDTTIGKKNEAILSAETVESLTENGKIFFDISFIDTPVILQLFSILKDPDVFYKEYSPTIKDTIRKLLTEPKESILAEHFSKELIQKISNIINLNIKVEDGEIKGYKNGSSIPIKLENLATGIKSFSLLILLIEKGFITKNTVLVLDEPEVHLHPKWQLEYARVIVELVKNGIKVIVATHSPYMLEMLEVLSLKENIDTNFYIPKEINEYIEFQNLKCGNLQSIYQLLSEPYEMIEEEARSFREAFDE
jgi:predicted ATP-binding protein involved in virulence